MINFGLKNKKVLIFGGSKGIGERVAYDFVAQGANVTLVARSKKKLKIIKKNLDKIKSGNNIFPVNLIPIGKPTTTIKKIFKKIGIHEIVIHCIGGGLGVQNPPKNYLEWEKVWRFNCGIAIEANQEILKYLNKNKYGRLIHISSYAGQLAKPKHNKIAYSASKSYLNSYIQNMSKLYGHKNIIFNGVMPGPMLTKGKYWEKTLKKDPKKTKKYLTENFSIKRFAELNEISPFVLALASKFSSYSSGSIIDLSGGEI